MQYALGVAMLLTAFCLIVRAYLRLVERANHGTGGQTRSRRSDREVVVRSSRTILLGAVGGLMVGMTSVGSGSLIIIGLMTLYPGLRASQLVGTDLAQAVPLVWLGSARPRAVRRFRVRVITASC